jgi:hypothetical protein
MKQMNPAHIYTLSFFKMHFKIIVLSVFRSPSFSFLFKSATNILYAFLNAIVHSLFTTHFVVLGMVKKMNKKGHLFEKSAEYTAPRMKFYIINSVYIKLMSISLNSVIR